MGKCADGQKQLLILLVVVREECQVFMDNMVGKNNESGWNEEIYVVSER